MLTWSYKACQLLQFSILWGGGSKENITSVPEEAKWISKKGKKKYIDNIVFTYIFLNKKVKNCIDNIANPERQNDKNYCCRLLTNTI